MDNQNKSADNILVIIMALGLIGVVTIVTLVIAFFNNF